MTAQPPRRPGSPTPANQGASKGVARAQAVAAATRRAEIRKQQERDLLIRLGRKRQAT